MKHYDSPVQQILDEDNDDPVVLKDDIIRVKTGLRHPPYLFCKIA